MTRRFLIVFVLISGLAAIFFYVSFFWNFNSTLSDWASFGFVLPHQLFHNFLHGRVFQVSVYSNVDGAVGLVFNPYAFTNYNIVHIHLTPYLFAFLWAAHPTPAWLVGIIILWNLAGGVFLTWVLLRRSSPRDLIPKVAFALAVFFGGGLLRILDQMGQFLLFAGPLILGAYAALEAQRKGWFLAAIVALCLVSEDAAMAVVAFAAFLWLFEREKRSFAWMALGTAVPYLLLVLLVIQPASRAGLVMTESSTAAAVVKNIFRVNPQMLAANLKGMLPVFTLLPAFVLAGFLFGWPKRRQAWEIAALATLPAFPHWGESLVAGGSHHLLPPFCFTYLALLRMLGEGRADGRAWLDRRPPAAAFAAAALFFAVSLRALAPDLPNAMRLTLYRGLGQGAKVLDLEHSFAMGEESSNLAVIRAAASLPDDKSLVFLGNYRMMGFLTGRSDFWPFPRYFDRTDYLLVQKDASDLAYSFEPFLGPDLRSALRNSPPQKGWCEQRGVVMRPDMWNRILRTLVDQERTHRVVLNDEHILLLENLKPQPFEMPSSTMGFRWRR